MGGSRFYYKLGKYKIVITSGYKCVNINQVDIIMFEELSVLLQELAQLHHGVQLISRVAE